MMVMVATSSVWSQLGCHQKRSAQNPNMQVAVEEGKWRLVILLVQVRFWKSCSPFLGGQRGTAEPDCPLGLCGSCLARLDHPAPPAFLLLGWTGGLTPSPQQQVPGGRSCSHVSHLHPLSLDLSFFCPDKLNHISLPACCHLLYIDPQ